MASGLKYSILFALLLFIPIPVLYAQAPSPTTAAPKKVNAGVPNDTIDISQPGTFTQQITKLNFEFGKGGLTPSEDFSIADFENSAKMLESTALQPKMIQDITIDAQNNLYISGTATLCVRDPDTGKLEEKKGGTYTTEPVPELSLLDQNSRRIAGLMTRYLRHNFDDRRPPLEIASTAECEEKATGTPTEETQVKLATGLDFFESIFVYLSKILTGGKEKETVTVPAWIASKQFAPYADSARCLITGGCENGIANTSYLDPKEAENVEESGGIAQAHAAYMFDITGGVTNSEETNAMKSQGGTTDTKTRVQQGAAINNSTKLVACTSLPLLLQGGNIENADTACTPLEREPLGGSCSEQLPNMKISDASCGLCKTEKFSNFLKEVNPEYVKQLPKGSLPKIAISILNEAAETFKVPAPILLGIMIQEGAFTWPEWQWTEDNVSCWAAPGGSIGQKSFGDTKSCLNRAHPTTKARGAFGWIDRWFKPYSDAVNTIKNIDPKRKRAAKQITQCNFMDAAFAAAKSLSQVSGGDTSLPSTRAGIQLLRGVGPAGSCNAWDSQRAATAQIKYAPDAGDNAILRTVNAFEEFKCF